MERFDARLETLLESGARTDVRLNRAIRLSVCEARVEHAKRRELDEKMIPSLLLRMCRLKSAARFDSQRPVF